LDDLEVSVLPQIPVKKLGKTPIFEELQKIIEHDDDEKASSRGSSA
jgi:hypothetical protein